MEGEKKNAPLICLDPGHGGKYNPGAVDGYYESEMNWILAGMLKTELEHRGLGVKLTKDSLADNPGLHTRGKRAKGADLLLSIHSNGASGTAPDYPLALCNVDGSVDELGTALVKLVEHRMGTCQHGQIWHKVASSGTGDWYSVLNAAKKVGVSGLILEHSFHTNPRACAWLMNRANLQELAQREAEIIARHFGIYTLECFVEDVQKALGAEVSGKADQQTLCRTITVSQSVNRLHGVVAPIQKRLYALGYTQVGEADGRAGPKFTAAVRAFQSTGTGRVDGEITAGQLTWKRLLGVRE